MFRLVRDGKGKQPVIILFVGRMNMNRLTFHSTISAPWTEMEPIRLGQVPTGLGTPDCFVTVEGEHGPLLRVDLFRSNEESFPFKEISIWTGFVAIGWGHHLYLVEPQTRQVSDLNPWKLFLAIT